MRIFTKFRLRMCVAVCVSGRDSLAQVKKAVEDGNLEVAKVYASNAIREKNQGLNYLKLASKLDSVAAKLKQV